MIKSDDIKELSIALAKAQGELREAPTDAKNTFFNKSKKLFIRRPPKFKQKHGMTSSFRALTPMTE